MKDYLITDRSLENTKYYAGLRGWVNLPENAIWFATKEEASVFLKYLKDDNLKVEEIDTESFD